MKRLATSCRPRERETGLTLLETAIALAVGSALVLVFGRVMMGTTTSASYLLQESAAVQDIEHGVVTIRDELRTSSPGMVTIATGTYFDVLTFQATQGGVAGAEDQTGTFRASWAIRYTVNGTDLDRQLLNTLGVVSESQVAVEDLDLTSTTTKGFSVTRNGSLYVINLRVTKPLADGKSVTRSARTAVLISG